jgi:hypothetical protein
LLLLAALVEHLLKELELSKGREDEEQKSAKEQG